MLALFYKNKTKQKIYIKKIRDLLSYILDQATLDSKSLNPNAIKL